MISNWTGTLAGTAVFLLLHTKKNAANNSSVDSLYPCTWFYLFFVFFSGMKPFDVTFASSSAFSKANLSALVPFLSYFKNPEIWNIDDVIKATVLFLPIGCFWSYLQWQHRIPWRKIYVSTSIVGFVLGAFIEAFQLFSPTRSADITDALLFGIGRWLGTFSLYYYSQEIRPKLGS